MISPEAVGLSYPNARSGGLALLFKPMAAGRLV
jgi:hypothetical protein